MTERRSLQQQRMAAELWAEDLRSGMTVAQVALKRDVSEKQIYRDLHAGDFSVVGLTRPPRRPEPDSEVIPEDGDRPPWARLSHYEIAFLHRVRDEIRAADRAMAARGIFMD